MECFMSLKQSFSIIVGFLTVSVLFAQEVTFTIPGTNVTKFYDYYAQWANSDGVKKLSRREFSRKICERFTKERFADGYFYLGVCNKLTLEGEMENYLEQLIQAQNTTV